MPAATNAAPQPLARYAGERPVGPIRRFNVRRSNVNSIHDEIPAEIVSPATPHRELIANQCGSGIAEMYPSTVVNTTRMMAKFSGVRVSFNA